jgi:steroid 5-alpha reductase family enzyme
MTLVWLLSLVRRDASIVDVFWGPAFAVAAWIYVAGSGTRAARGVLAAVLVTLWGLRLALHILTRSRGRGEDYRYHAMRERDPAGFRRRSLLTVFWLQAFLVWAVSAPLFQAQRAGPAGFTPFDGLGLALFTLGFLFEAVGDWQLAAWAMPAVAAVSSVPQTMSTTVTVTDQPASSASAVRSKVE